MFPDDLIWENWNSDESLEVPPNAVCGGIDADRSRIYIGRVFHENHLLPAKIIPKKKNAFVAYGGQEHKKSSAQILIENDQNRFEWIEKQGPSIPPNAVKGGTTELGEPLYIGRVWFKGSKTIGKIHPSHGCLYIAFDGLEYGFKKYEIFVRKE
ncbi:natterin-3 [Agrilus planipennis]|uniref:Natterin-3 n=1 Tax=Agrilus planipennis TaxID=224129 RepID=A0A1W4WD47_AGRPL|nr:natterin-3 [Agrilus planipennis]